MVEKKGFGITDKGKQRKNNEDFLLLNESKSLYIVADGMGGHKAGEVASQLSCEYFIKYFNANFNNIKEHLFEIFNQTNNLVFNEAQKQDELSGMGTTFIACHIESNNAHFVHAGDVRAYLFRKNNLKQLTEDHSTIALMLKNKLITKEEAKEHPLRNNVNKALGIDENIKPDYTHLKILQNDLILLCSDGLWGMIDDEIIQNILKTTKNIELKTKELIKNANNAGGKDNITALLIKIQ